MAGSTSAPCSSVTVVGNQIGVVVVDDRKLRSCRPRPNSSPMQPHAWAQMVEAASTVVVIERGITRGWIGISVAFAEPFPHRGRSRRPRRRKLVTENLRAAPRRWLLKYFLRCRRSHDRIRRRIRGRSVPQMPQVRGLMSSHELAKRVRKPEHLQRARRPWRRTSPPLPWFSFLFSSPITVGRRGQHDDGTLDNAPPRSPA